MPLPSWMTTTPGHGGGRGGGRDEVRKGDVGHGPWSHDWSYRSRGVSWRSVIGLRTEPCDGLARPQADRPGRFARRTGQRDDQEPARRRAVRRRRRRHRRRARGRERPGAAVLAGAHDRRPVVDPRRRCGRASPMLERLPGRHDRRGAGRRPPPGAAGDRRVPRRRLRARRRCPTSVLARDDGVPRVPAGRPTASCRCSSRTCSSTAPTAGADHVGRRDPRRRARRRRRSS